MLSSYMPYAASCESSRNGLPGSISMATRSRGRSLPRAACFARAASPPPASIARTFSRRSATSALIAARLAANVASRASSWVPSTGTIRGVALASRDGMAGHELVRMHPSGLAADAREPVADVRIVVPVDADLVFEEEIPAHRKIGDGEAVRHHKLATAKMRIHHAPGGFGTRAQELEHRGIRAGLPGAEEPVCCGVARELVIVVEDPAQDLAPLGGVSGAEASQRFGQVLEDHPGLGEQESAMLEHRHLAHHVLAAIRRRS